MTVMCCAQSTGLVSASTAAPAMLDIHVRPKAFVISFALALSQSVGVGH